MTQTHFGCSHSELWASPANWQTTTAKSALDKSWFVQCYFFDPAFAEKYPKGFAYRCKVNKGKTIAARKAAVEMMLQEMPALLAEGFNPITKMWMPIEQPEDEKTPLTYSPVTPLFEALDMALELCCYSGAYLVCVKSVLDRFKKAAACLHYETLPVGSFIGINLKLIMDFQQKTNPQFTDKMYNKHISYLSPLFTHLIANGLMQVNPLTGLLKKQTIKEVREVMTMEQRRLVHDRLQLRFPSFLNFIQIYFHSGGRIVELLSLKVEDVDLINLKYKAFVKKGKQYKWIERPIKKISVTYWITALKEAQPDNYIFSVRLKPGKQKIRREQITRRWNIHVKDKLGITADFASMKHNNLTEISEKQNSNVAAAAAGHTTDVMVKKHYDVQATQRSMDKVREMTNEFAPKQKLHSTEVCYSAPVTFFKVLPKAG